jgi:hypothetical protein
MRFTCFTCFTSTKVHILTGEVGQTTEAIKLKTEYCDAVYLLFFFFADNRGRSQHEQHRAHRGVRQAGGGLSASVFVLLYHYSKYFYTRKAIEAYAKLAGGSLRQYLYFCTITASAFVPVKQVK